MSGRPVTVLVVEDDRSVLDTVCTGLSSHGFLPLRAESLERALTILDRQYVDAVILDVRMPDPRGYKRSGLEILSYLRLTQAYLATPVVVLTGSPLSEEEEEVIRRGHAHFFQKPVPLERVVEWLQQETAQQIVR